MSVQVFPGHRNDLFVDIDIHDNKEFRRSHTAYINLVPRELVLRAERVLDNALEQHPPKQDAANVVPIVMGNEIRAPILDDFGFVVLCVLFYRLSD